MCRANADTQGRDQLENRLVPTSRLMFSPRWRNCSCGPLGGRKVRWGVKSQSWQAGNYPLGSQGDLLGSYLWDSVEAYWGTTLWNATDALHTTRNHRRRETQGLEGKPVPPVASLQCPLLTQLATAAAGKGETVSGSREEWDWRLRGSLNLEYLVCSIFQLFITHTERIEYYIWAIIIYMCIKYRYGKHLI